MQWLVRQPVKGRNWSNCDISAAQHRLLQVLSQLRPLHVIWKDLAVFSFLYSARLFGAFFLWSRGMAVMTARKTVAFALVLSWVRVTAKIRKAGAIKIKVLLLGQCFFFPGNKVSKTQTSTKLNSTLSTLVILAFQCLRSNSMLCFSDLRAYCFNLLIFKWGNKVVIFSWLFDSSWIGWYIWFII